MIYVYEPLFSGKGQCSYGGEGKVACNGVVSNPVICVKLHSWCHQHYVFPSKRQTLTTHSANKNNLGF